MMIKNQFNKKQTGFTIVELLIVIVVIGILAAISIVAYSGIQDRAENARLQAGMSSLNKAIQLFYSENGTYPLTGVGVWRGYNSAINDNFIPGIVPKYINATPQVGLAAQYPTFIYRSDTGQDYKLIYIVSGTSVLPAAQTNNNALLDPVRSTRAWGYWNAGGASY